MGRKISIKDFAAERKVSYNAITQFIYRRKKNNVQNGVKIEELTRQNGVKVIDEDSQLYKLLDERYPKPVLKTVEVSQNEEIIELYKKIDTLRERLEEEQENSKKLIAQVAQLQIVKQQFEISTAEKDKAFAERDAYREKFVKSRVKEEEAQKRAESAEKKIEKMNNASLWNRLRKKW